MVVPSARVGRYPSDNFTASVVVLSARVEVSPKVVGEVVIFSGEFRMRAVTVVKTLFTTDVDSSETSCRKI